jgi:MFS family permease
MVMFALIPYLALSAALQPLTPIIAKQLHTSLQTMSLSSGLANAAYAAGTVMAVQFAQHLPQRRMLIVYATLLVIGSVLAAAAQDPGMYIAGHVIQGLCTSLLLISAVPPLAIGYPASKLRTTAVIMNMCIFGAVALGPAIGGLQAHFDAWRPLFWIIAAIATSALVLSVLTFDDAPPADPDSPRDPLAIALAAVGCAAAFFGASELLTHSFLDPVAIVPLLGGLAMIVVLIVYQFRAKRPLLTIRTMLTSTMPVAGIVVALFAAAASVSATVLTAAVLAERYGPLHVGLLYLPEVAGAVITAILLGVVITRRAMHYLPLAGMVFLAAGIAVFRIEVPSSEAATLLGSFLTGIGLGATVAPALFVAGFSLPSASRADAGGGRVHDRADLRSSGRDRRRQPRCRHQHRPVDRPRARAGRRRARRRDLRARRRPPADARPRALRGGRGPCVVLAAAAGETSSRPCNHAPRHRERQLRWRRATHTPQRPPCPPARCSSPTTAAIWRSSRSSRPAASSRPDATR